MDYHLYTIAKMRQQEKIMEAEIWRLLKSARTEPGYRPMGLRSRFLMWLGGHRVPSTKLQMQSK